MEQHSQYFALEWSSVVSIEHQAEQHIFRAWTSVLEDKILIAWLIVD